ncbi:MAG: hypothetical protein RIR70_1812 [Pseudomonadota bacterium]|jgi:hypothetical protein
MSAPRTAREALMAELLGDMDALLARVEALPRQVAASEERLAQSVAALDEAGDRFRLAVTAFTEQAKSELAEYLDRKASEAADKTVREQRAALEEATRTVFRSESAGLGKVLDEAARELRPSRLGRLVDCLAAAIISTLLTVIGLLYSLQGFMSK